MCVDETIGKRQTLGVSPGMGLRGPMRVLSTRAGRAGVLLVGIVFSLLCFGEAALAQKRGGVLRMFHRDNPPSTSILEEFSPSTVVPFMPVFNNLVIFDPSVPQNSDKSIVPDLAESWSWNDDKTELTFKLRRGVKWHDGWAFTAADVECTFNLLTGRARDKLRHNPRGSWYGNINYVHGSNDYEVTIHLNHPQPSLLTLLASGLSPIYPCHVPSAQMRIKPIGTGPFKLDSFKQFDSVRLVRNPDYFKPGKPHLDGIEFHIVSSPSTAMLSFVAGRFDITFPWEVTIPQLRDVRRQSPRAVCETTSMNNNTNILVNREAAPFDKPEIRRALSLALDRRAFIAANEGDGQIGGTMQPPSDGMWGLSADKLAAVPGYGPDVEKNRQEARAIMGRAGFSPEKRMRTKVQTRALSLYRNPATLLVDQLREIHIDAELDVVEASHWFPRDQPQGLHDRAQHHGQRRRRSRPGVLRELLLPLGAQLQRLLQRRDRAPVRAAVVRARSRQAPADGVGDRRQAAGRRRAADHHVEPQRDLLAALRQGLRRPGQQHVQRLPLRGRLAGSLTARRPLMLLPRIRGSREGAGHDDLRKFSLKSQASALRLSLTCLSPV